MNWKNIVKRELNPDEVEEDSEGRMLTGECDQCKKKISNAGGNVHRDGRLICIPCSIKNKKAWTKYSNMMANSGRGNEALRHDQWFKENTQEELP